MKNAARFLALALLAVGVAGCNPTQPTATATPKAATANPVPAAPKVPDNLKTEGFAYYGLNNEKPLTYAVRAEGEEPAEGVQTVELKNVEGGVANYTVSRTGGLSRMGDESLVAKPDGVYLTRSTWGQVEPPMLSFPDKATEGKSWKTGSSMKGEDNRTVVLESTWTVGKAEKIKVEAGEFDVIKVTGTGTLKLGKETHPLKAEGWYSKELGAVKMVVKSKDDKGKDKSSVVELKKVG